MVWLIVGLTIGALVTCVIIGTIVRRFDRRDRAGYKMNWHGMP